MKRTIETDLCIVGSGAAAQAVIRTASPSRRITVLEAGSPGPSNRSLTHAIGSDLASSSPHAADPSSQLSFRVGGSLDLPRAVLDENGRRTNGIRVTRMSAGDFLPRFGLRGWPIEISDLDEGYRIAEEMFGFDSGVVSSSAISGSSPSIHPFWLVSRQPISDPERLGDDPGIDLVPNAPVARLEIDEGGSVTAAVVVTADGETFDVRASDFVLACGTYSITRILLESDWSGGRHAANSSGLLGVGLTDHPQLHLATMPTGTATDWSRITELAPHPVGNHVSWPMLTTPADEERIGLASLVLPSAGKDHRSEPRPSAMAIRSAQELADGLRERRLGASTARALGRALRHSPQIARQEYLRRRRNGARWSFENGWWPQSDVDATPESLSLFALAEQLPHEANRVELSETRTHFGWRRLRIRWEWSDQDRRLATLAAEPLLEAYREFVGEVSATPSDRHILKFSSHHPAGTTRMSASASDGIVDEDGRTHDHPNLWIVGAATFPSGGFANPTLTSMALGAKTGICLAGTSQIESSV